MVVGFTTTCPCHNATRLRYIHTINLPINLNMDLLLFGSTDLTNTLNTDIFLNVQKFIIVVNDSPPNHIHTT
jgi:hypothetical protein